MSLVLTGNRKDIRLQKLCTSYPLWNVLSLRTSPLSSPYTCNSLPLLHASCFTSVYSNVFVLNVGLNWESNLSLLLLSEKVMVGGIVLNRMCLGKAANPGLTARITVNPACVWVWHCSAVAFWCHGWHILSVNLSLQLCVIYGLICARSNVWWDVKPYSTTACAKC